MKMTAMESEWDDDCDEEHEQGIKMSACTSLKCRMRFTHDNATGPNHPCRSPIPTVLDISILALCRHCFRYKCARNVEDISLWNFEARQGIYRTAESMEMHVFLVRGKFIKLFCRVLLHLCATVMNIDENDTLDCIIFERNVDGSFL